MSPRIHSVDDIASLVGVPLGPSEGLCVDQAMIDLFADATHDHQWIHVDRERAAQGPFASTIAHGYLLVSLIPGLLNQVLDVEVPGRRINYGLNRVRFVSPVLSGAVIHLRATVVSVEEVDGGRQVTLDVTLEEPDASRPACVAQVLYRWYP